MHSVEHVHKPDEASNPPNASAASRSASNPGSSVSTVSTVSTMGEAVATRRSLASLLSSGTLSSLTAGN